MPNISDPWIEENCKNLGYMSVSEALEYMNCHKICGYIATLSKTRPPSDVWAWNLEETMYCGEAADGSDLLLADEKRPGCPWFETNPHRRFRNHSADILRAWTATDLNLIDYPDCRKWVRVFEEGWVPNNIWINVIVPLVQPDFAKVWSKRLEATAVDLYAKNWKKLPHGNIIYRDRELADLDPTIRAHAFSIAHAERNRNINPLGLLAYVS